MWDLILIMMRAGTGKILLRWFRNWSSYLLEFVNISHWSQIIFYNCLFALKLRVEFANKNEIWCTCTGHSQKKINHQREPKVKIKPLIKWVGINYLCMHEINYMILGRRQFWTMATIKNIQCKNESGRWSRCRSAPEYLETQLAKTRQKKTHLIFPKPRNIVSLPRLMSRN